MTKKVIVLGAGVSGLASAIVCKSLGYRVILIEKRMIGSHVGGGIDIHPNGTKVLFSLGVEKEIRALTKVNIREIAIGIDSGETVNRVPLNLFEKDPQYPLVSFLRQDLLKVLFDAAEIDELYEQTACTEIIEKENGVEVVLENKKRPLSGDFLIGADGINSIARKKLNPRIFKKYLGHISIGGCVPIKYYRHNYIHGLRRTCVVLPCISGVCHTVMFCPKPEGWMRQNTKTFEERKKLMMGWSDEVDAILENLKDENRFAVESYEIPPLDNYASKHIFLIGDSAHAMSPLGALATSLALEDVSILKECLINVNSITKAAKEYHMNRQPRAIEYRNFSWKFLIPTITQHGQNDFETRIDRLRKAPPEQIFAPLVNLTQADFTKVEHATT